MTGRRAKLRAELLQGIRAAALSELKRVGAAALSLRDVASVAGISPSGLYRYVDGRDGLLELLISDGFESLGAAIEVAVDRTVGDAADRMEAVAIAYRRWALNNLEQFGLILGTPVPGFHAREDGPTEPSVRRFAEPMIRVVAAARAASQTAGPREVRAGDIDLAGFNALTGGLPNSLVDVLVRSWSRVHGLVALEAFGHLRWSGADVEALLRTEVHSIVAELEARLSRS
ncbi:MAG: TetR/AcrR family transcriptional regulator [Actinomycetales bacterium]